MPPALVPTTVAYGLAQRLAGADATAASLQAELAAVKAKLDQEQSARRDIDRFVHAASPPPIPANLGRRRGRHSRPRACPLTAVGHARAGACRRCVVSAKREAERSQASASVEVESLKARLTQLEAEHLAQAKAVAEAQAAVQVERAKAEQLANNQASLLSSSQTVEQDLAALKDKLGRKGTPPTLPPPCCTLARGGSVRAKLTAAREALGPSPRRACPQPRKPRKP